ncbi:MAG: tRNA preQ1(34) S-adenosylmethionine ribosyltransferase-isomerase QueA [bacterium]
MSERLSDYDFQFPPQLVAQEPLAEREGSRMMVLERSAHGLSHARFQDLPRYLRPGDLVVANDTAVLASRLFARKATGGVVEVFLLRPRAALEWEVFLSPTRGLREGLRLPLFSRVPTHCDPPHITIASLREGEFRVRFDSPQEERAALESWGEMPLPPYIERSSPRPEDRERYQTVFAKNPGAVAAPTAGLHFTPEMRDRLSAQGVAWATVTLHVGAGTFLPVKCEEIQSHRMHCEAYEVPAETVAAIRRCREAGGRVLAVGTTSLRALESWALSGRTRGETDLFIRPGFRFQVVDCLLTNFHQPKSTLLMLVSALAGREFILRAYREAIAAQYRLFSYGDCMLILSGP